MKRDFPIVFPRKHPSGEEPNGPSDPLFGFAECKAFDASAQQMPATGPVFSDTSKTFALKRLQNKPCGLVSF